MKVEEKEKNKYGSREEAKGQREKIGDGIWK